ncbi:MAG TPA: hypothetical protein VER33_07375 [Polyangiaceae bacterium]|nr:hypothetical protein [Polyangiaceae bacterium]
MAASVVGFDRVATGEGPAVGGSSNLGGASGSLHVTDKGPFAYNLFKFALENTTANKPLRYDDVALGTPRVG